MKNEIFNILKESSYLLQIISKQEELKLKSYFLDINDFIFSQAEKDDIEIKYLALHSLFIYIKNNPSIENEITQTDKKYIYKLALNLYELSTIIGKKNNFYFLLSVLYACLSNQLTFIDFNYYNIDKIKENVHNLEDFVVICIISLFMNVTNKDFLEKRKSLLNELDKIFQKTQKECQSEEDILKIVSFSNLVTLTKKVYLYITKGEGKLDSQIDNYIINSVKVFSKLHYKEWELLSNLLRYAFKNLITHSVWTFSDTNPHFKKYIEEQISNQNFLFSLLPSQKEIIQDVLSSVSSMVISMPTSSGKTLMAELKILYTMHLYEQQCIIAYVVPTNALVNQTLIRLKKSFPKLNIEKLLPYNCFDEVEEEVFTQQKTDIIVTTPEKLNFLVKNDKIDLLKELRLVIIDEAHNIEDSSRGSVTELLLATLKNERKSLSYLLLTPFIKNSEQIAKWLNQDNFKSKQIEWSPTKQYIGYNKTKLKNKEVESIIHYLPSSKNSIIKEGFEINLGKAKSKKKQDLNIALVNNYKKITGTILILVNSIKSLEKQVKTLYEYFKNDKSFYNIKENKDIIETKKNIEFELGDDYPLINYLDYGIAYHHSRLTLSIRDSIEDLVSKGLIKLLLATTTLAQGMNFPIKTVIFSDMVLGGGKNQKDISYNNFWNIAGRAGRAYKDIEGHIIIGSNKNAKEKAYFFIKENIKDTISSLKYFFDKIDENSTIDYDFIKNEPIAQNFLQYLNHLLNISYQYNLDQLKIQDIRNILSNSLYFKQEDFSEGFIETQNKVINFSKNYIKSLKDKKAKDLKLADALGITNISLNTILGLYQNNKYCITDSIKTKNMDELSVIIENINRIPELKLNFGNTGNFEPKLIAKILLGWVHGESIKKNIYR